jgi:hypothetical protein
VVTLYPGNIVFVKGSGLLGWLCRNVISPPSDVVHAFILREYIPELGDYEFIESNVAGPGGIIPKGIQHGLVYERYSGASVEIYRVPDSVCSQADQALAPLGLLPCGNDTYDFFFFVKIVVQLPKVVWRMLFQEHTIRKVRPEDFLFDPDKTPTAICTRAVWLAYMFVGLPLVPASVPPFPNAYMEARDQRLIELVYKGVL